MIYPWTADVQQHQGSWCYPAEPPSSIRAPTVGVRQSPGTFSLVNTGTLGTWKLHGLRATLAGLTILSTGCSQSIAVSGPDAAQQVISDITRQPLEVSKRDQIAPLVDAHQHLMSRTAMSVVVPHKTLPEVSIPSHLQGLLRAREQVGGAAPFEAVFTDDAAILAEEEGRWWTGKDKILDAIDNFPGGKFVPKSYQVDRSAGFIAGNIQSSRSGQATHNFLLGIRKGRSGEWRISSEMKSDIPPPIYSPEITAETVIAALDDAGIRYGVVLSLGYWFGQPGREIENRYEKTRAENDWTVAQAAKYPDRLVAFCGVTPTADYALRELERCAGIPAVRGMKIHFGNAGVDLSNRDQLQKVRQFFRAVNSAGLAIVVHLRGNADIFLRDVLPEAPDVPVQVAHMGGGWPNTRLFAEAITSGSPVTRNLYFDWTQALPIDSAIRTPEVMARSAATMRKIGLHRIFFGSDMPLRSNPTPRDWWKKTVATLPLTDEELQDIADNIPPYFSERRAFPVRLQT